MWPSPLQGEAEEVVGLNPQLARLFGAPRVLLPFTWDERQPELRGECVAFLALVEAALPLAEKPELAGTGMARRLHAASGGVMAHLMELLRGATYLALAEGRPTLDREVVGRAFAQRLASVRRGTVNPFRAESRREEEEAAETARGTAVSAGEEPGGGV